MTKKVVLIALFGLLQVVSAQAAMKMDFGPNNKVLDECHAVAATIEWAKKPCK